MNVKMAVEILRSTIVQFSPEVAGCKPISKQRAGEIADFIQHQERDAELGRAIFEVFHTSVEKLGVDCPVDACNGDTECKHCPFKKVCDLVTEREKRGVQTMNVLDRIERGELKVIVKPGNENAPITYQQAREYEPDILHLARLGQQMRWVSVEERLPEEGQVVDLWLRSDERMIEMTTYKDSKEVYFAKEYESMVFIHYVTYWRLSDNDRPEGVKQDGK